MKTCVFALCVFLSVECWGIDRYTALCEEAAAASEKQDYQSAILKYKAALVIRPNAPEVFNNLAVMYYQAGQFSEALHLTAALWQGHPELKSAALIAGMAAVQCNRPAEAIEPLRSLLKTDPGNRDALLALASALFALKDLTQAIEIYERRIQTAPTDAQAWYGAAICHERLAEDASRKLAVTSGGLPYSKRLLAEYLQGLGDSKLAAEAFGESVTDGTESPEAARLYEQARASAEKSRQAFERFVTLAPDSWQAALFFGDVARQRGDLKAAITRYETVMKQQPENPAPLLGLGTAYWELGDFERATTYLQQALRRKPDSLPAVFGLANIHVRQHRDREAIPLLQQYLAAQPDALAARADLGRAFLHLRQFGNAAQELAKATGADTNGEIHYQLSVALRNLGRVEEADASLKKSVALREDQLKRSQRLHTVQ